jgi:hypothetical protein
LPDGTSSAATSRRRRPLRARRCRPSPDRIDVGRCHPSCELNAQRLMLGSQTSTASGRTRSSRFAHRSARTTRKTAGQGHTPTPHAEPPPRSSRICPAADAHTSRDEAGLVPRSGRSFGASNRSLNLEDPRLRDTQVRPPPEDVRSGRGRRAAPCRVCPDRQAPVGPADRTSGSQDSRRPRCGERHHQLAGT